MLVSLESSSAGMFAFALHQVESWFTFFGYACAVFQDQAGRTLVGDALVESPAESLTFLWTIDFQTLAVIQGMASWTTGSFAVTILECESSSATDSRALAIGSLDESSVTLFNTSLGSPGHLLHDETFRTVLVDALLATPDESLAFFTSWLTLALDDFLVFLAMNPDTLSSNFLVAGFALHLEALSVNQSFSFFAVSGNAMAVDNGLVSTANHLVAGISDSDLAFRTSDLLANSIDNLLACWTVNLNASRSDHSSRSG